MLEKIKDLFKKETIGINKKNKTVICVKCGKSVSSFSTDENYNNYCLNCHNEKFK